MSNLVIVESPNKVPSLKKYLGNDYEILATVGHIVYLPSSGEYGFGINMKTWTPNYKIDPKKRKIIKQIKNALKGKKEIYIATDIDREGEAIGQNLVHFLKLKNDYKRIRFNEISKEAIEKAVLNPTKIDKDLVNSQVARRILDRMIGYKLSKLMRNKIGNSPTVPSAGRVQSIALKKVVERESKILEFLPVKYITVSAIIDDKLHANLISGNYQKQKEWVNPKEIDKIKKDFKGKLTVSNIKKLNRKDNRKIPLKQATLYKKGVSKFGISSYAIQFAAQRLYEGYGDGGLISYPRTDSTRLANTFVKKAKLFIIEKYGEKYFNSEIKGFAGAQDAHEAIRPTNLEITPTIAKNKFNLSVNEEKIYKLIYNHTIMCLMMVPIRKNIIYYLEEGINKFKISCSKIIFDGYLKVLGYEENDNFVFYEKNQIIPVRNYKIKNTKTLPPPRYNDGSLIEILDKIGVGRPSTFSTIINILKNRLYVEQENKAMKLTKFGEVVYEKLSEGFPNIIDEKYTANMEQELDKVAEGNIDYKKILDSFWKNFEKVVENATQIISLTKLDPTLANKNCVKCNEPMIIRINKIYKTKFFGCSNFPECKYTESYPFYIDTKLLVKNSFNINWNNKKATVKWKNHLNLPEEIEVKYYKGEGTKITDSDYESNFLTDLRNGDKIKVKFLIKSKYHMTHKFPKNFINYLNLKIIDNNLNNIIDTSKFVKNSFLLSGYENAGNIEWKNYITLPEEIEIKYYNGTKQEPSDEEYTRDAPNNLANGDNVKIKFFIKRKKDAIYNPLKTFINPINFKIDGLKEIIIIDNLGKESFEINNDDGKMTIKWKNNIDLPEQVEIKYYKGKKIKINDDDYKNIIPIGFNNDDEIKIKFLIKSSYSSTHKFPKNFINYLNLKITDGSLKNLVDTSKLIISSFLLNGYENAGTIEWKNYIALPEQAEIKYYNGTKQKPSDEEYTRDVPTNLANGDNVKIKFFIKKNKNINYAFSKSFKNSLIFKIKKLKKLIKIDNLDKESFEINNDDDGKMTIKWKNNVDLPEQVEIKYYKLTKQNYKNYIYNVTAPIDLKNSDRIKIKFLIKTKYFRTHKFPESFINLLIIKVNELNNKTTT